MDYECTECGSKVTNRVSGIDSYNLKEWFCESSDCRWHQGETLDITEKPVWVTTQANTANPKVLRARLLHIEEQLEELQVSRAILKNRLQEACLHPAVGQYVANNTYNYMEYRVCLDCGLQEEYGSYRLFWDRGLYDENTRRLTETEFYQVHRP